MKRVRLVLAILFLGLVSHAPTGATPVLGPWVPVFRGVDHATGTNTPGDGMPNLHVVHFLRVDLADPDLRLFSSPRIDDYQPRVREPGVTPSATFSAGTACRWRSTPACSTRRVILRRHAHGYRRPLRLRGVVVSEQDMPPNPRRCVHRPQRPTVPPTAAGPDRGHPYCRVGQLPGRRQGVNVGYSYRSAGLHPSHQSPAPRSASRRIAISTCSSSTAIASYSSGAFATKPAPGSPRRRS
jgi:hypothetical protein